MVIPVINLHAMAAVLMVLIVLLGWIIWRSLTDSGGSMVRIDGYNWSLETPCAAATADLMAFAGIVLRMRSASAPGPEQSMAREVTAAESWR